MDAKRKPRASLAAPGAEVEVGVTDNMNNNTTQPQTSSDSGNAGKKVLGRQSYAATMRRIQREYFDSLNYDNPPTLEQVENDLSAEIFRAVNLRNSVAVSAQDKWPIPKELPARMVAEALLSVGGVARIELEKGDGESRVTGVYNPETGHYRLDQESLDAKMNVFGSDLTDARRASILRYVESEAVSLGLVKQVYRGDAYNKVGNGWYCRVTGDVEPNTPDRVSLYSPATSYNPDAELPVIEMPDGELWDIESAFLEFMGGEKARAEVLWQIVAAALRPNVSWNKAAFLYNEEGNGGKGTFVRGVQNLIGMGACKKLSLEDFGKRFRLHGIGLVPVVIGDENNVKGFLDTPDDFKAAVTKDVLLDEQKGVQPFNTRFHGIIIQCLNRRPSVNDSTESYLRRVLPLKFEQSYTGRERTYIKEDYMARPEVLEYMMKRALEMEVEAFDMPESCKLELAMFDRANNNVTEFAFDVLGRMNLYILPQGLAYELYKGWLENDMPSAHPMGKRSFFDELEGVLKRHGDALGWMFDPDPKHRVRIPGKAFLVEEPLFEAYGLGKWVQWVLPRGSSTYECTHMLKQEMFSQKYRCLFKTALPSDEDGPEPPDGGPGGPGGSSSVQDASVKPAVPDVEYVDYDPDEGEPLLREEYEAYLAAFEDLVAESKRRTVHGPTRGWKSKGKWHMNMFHPARDPLDEEGWYTVDFDQKPPEADDPLPYGCWLEHRLNCPTLYDGKFQCCVVEFSRKLHEGEGEGEEMKVKDTGDDVGRST